MVVVRRRLIFWLLKAYIKKSKKILVISFLAGLLVFFAVLFGSRYLKAIFTLHRFPVIGISGSYQKENLPPTVSSKLSRGLTKIDKDGIISPDIANDYILSDNDRTYTFHLKQKLTFSDGSPLQSPDVNYNFSDVDIEKPDKNTLIFKLKDAYAPFLATVSKPIFKKGLIGTGDYFIKNIEINGNFVQSITLGLNRNRFETLKYVFYPTESALKTAFALGEITEADDLSSTGFQNNSFEKFPRTTVEKTMDYTHLVTLFYNTIDPDLSDKKMRLALNYALPENFKDGRANALPYPPESIYYNPDVAVRNQDYEHAKLLMPNPSMKVTITTLKKYKPVAQAITKSWSKVGITTNIKEVDEIPDRFQIFLGDFNVSRDPDQYALWHTGQINNITKFKNLRIDKLLEDGRKNSDVQERRKIYFDFQKFLLEDMPASFLYFPYSYKVTRN